MSIKKFWVKKKNLSEKNIGLKNVGPKILMDQIFYWPNKLCVQNNFVSNGSQKILGEKNVVSKKILSPKI